MEEDFYALNEGELKRLYELWPDLVDFDQRTGERGLFAETVKGLRQALPPNLDLNLLVIGHFLHTVLEAHDDKMPNLAIQSAAYAVMRAYDLRK